VVPLRQWPMMNSGGGVVGGLRSRRRKRASLKGSQSELKAAAVEIVAIRPHLESDALPPCSATSGSHTPSGMPCQNRGLHHG
jgi:hypothetical protein